MAKQPAQVKLVWNEPVDLGPGSIRLLDATGGLIKTREGRAIAGGDRTAAVMALPPGLKHGTYVVAWRVSSADSHPVSGAFSFSVGEPSALVTAGEPGSSGALVRVRRRRSPAGSSFLGFALAVGGACVLFLLWPEGPASRRGRRFLQAGIGLLMGGTVVVLLLQGPYASSGSLLEAFKPSLLSFSISTHFGQALIARLLLGLAFAGLVGADAARGDEPGAAVERGRVRGRDAVHLDADRPLAHRRADVARRARGDACTCWR